MAGGGSDGAGDGKHAHHGRPGTGEGAGTLAGRGARGEHVVHQDDVATDNGLRLGHGKRPTNVPPTRRRVEIRLGKGGPATQQHVGPHGNAPRPLEMPGQEQGLVIAALALAATMEGHGDEEIGRRPGQRGETHPGHQFAQWLGEPAPTAKLEGVDSLADQAAVSCRRAGIGEARAAPPTDPTEPFDSDRDAAATAPRGPDALEAFPARSAQWVTPVRAQHRATHGTERREDEVERRGNPGPPARGGGFGRR